MTSQTYEAQTKALLAEYNDPLLEYAVAKLDEEPLSTRRRGPKNGRQMALWYDSEDFRAILDALTTKAKRSGLLRSYHKPQDYIRMLVCREYLEMCEPD